VSNRGLKDEAQRRRQSQRTSKAGPAHRRAWPWFVMALIVIGVGILAANFAVKSNNQTHATQSTVMNKLDIPVDPATGDTAWDSAWPPLPQLGQPARPIEIVRATYAYAARRGDVLQYMPCYCGCERQGHRSNQDCFVKGRTQAGIPRWDPMGYT
jgi:hypothetical protein